MAQDFDTFLRKLDGMIGGLSVEIPKEMDVAALDTIATVQRRLQQTGKDQQGNAFRPYSKEYQAYKASKGRYKGYVDFTFDNLMLKGLKVSQRTTTGFQTTLIIRPNPQDQEKLDRNQAMRGDLLALQKGEQKIIKSDFIERVGEYVERSMV